VAARPPAKCSPAPIVAASERAADAEAEARITLVPALVYYVSGHGFGHAVRTAEILRALQRAAPNLPIHLRTTAPAWLFPPVASYTPIQLDVGVVQRDALDVDALGTLRAAARLVDESEALLARELDFLRSAGATLVAADIPPLALVAAARAGLPGVAIANFSWDWIYQPYARVEPDWDWLLEWLRSAYGHATLLLRLPFYGDLSAFPRIEDVPLVARQPSAARAVLRAERGLAPSDQVVLLGFGGIGLARLPVERLAALGDYLFLATEKDLAVDGTPPANVRLVASRQTNYDDLIAASDAVVGKPGFGMVASSLALGVPFLYTDRGEFPEYPILVQALHQLGRAAHVPQAELLRGNLGPYLGALLELPDPGTRPRADGATIIADRLLQLMCWPAASTMAAAPAPPAPPAR
jgi:hypothetical protein